MAPVPSAQLAHSSQDSPLLAQARDLDARLRQRATTRRRNFALDAFDLAECKRLELFRLLGYSSLTAYAFAVNGFGSSKTSDLVRIAEAAQELPRIREAFLAGRLDWCAAREIVKRATPADEAEWLEKADRLTVQELKAEADEAPPTYDRSLRGLSLEELGWVEAVRDAICHECGPVSLGKAIAEACRRMVSGEVANLGGPGFRHVIHHCPECERATRETTAGPAPVSPGELEQIGPDAEVLDIRNGPASVTRRPPPKIRNYVQGRDRGRCVAPGCRNLADHFHHGRGWRNGHDPDHCYGLCGSHHRAVHRGYEVVKGSLPDLHFYRRDGVYLGRAGDAKQATEVGPAAEETREASARAEGVVEEAASRPRGAPAVAEGAPDPEREALEALRGLELRAREARACLQRAIERHPGRAWEAEDLVLAALQELPATG